MSVRARVPVLLTSLAALSMIGGCAGGSSSPSPVGTQTPTPTPAPVTPINPVGPQPNPSTTPANPGPTPPNSSPSPGGFPTLTITIIGIDGSMSFSPNPASARVGQQVVWHNADMVTTPGHNATSSGNFTSETIAPGATSNPVTLTKAGFFDYVCTIHPTMAGTLNVTP